MDLLAGLVVGPVGGGAALPFVTVSVYVSGSPTMPWVGDAVLVTARSASSATSTVAVPELFPALTSSGEAAVAVLTSVAGVGGSRHDEGDVCA